ncbi:TNF domain-containing protein [Streptomyces sp. NBC_01216]|uniref:hypothetical protein n=1 Tax=Streptomyces sp. NBC_01216 TaxID=2903778 RepID=UPI002E0DFE3C|nr:TNF domain-containing protein [Streptomyces sp. NBC_01216]
MLTYSAWSSRQLVAASDLNPYLYENSKQLAAPSAFRVKGAESITSFSSRARVKWDMWDFQRHGWSSTDMVRFRCPSTGTYFVTANLTFRPPSDMDGKKSVTLYTLASTQAPEDDSYSDAIKSLTTTKIIGSYVSVNLSGLVHIPEGFHVFASVTGWGGTWTQATSSNENWSMNSFGAIQIAPDAKGLGA